MPGEAAYRPWRSCESVAHGSWRFTGEARSEAGLDAGITSNRSVEERLGLFDDPLLAVRALDRLADASYS